MSGAHAPQGREGLRQAMSWLHTWAGLVLGWLLFAIFLTGTLSFFRDEFNQWMRPELHRLPAADAQVAQKSVDALLRRAPETTQWFISLPDARNPDVRAAWRTVGGPFQTARLNPQTGEPIATRQTMGGDFFYRFHFELRTAQKGRWTLQGRWVVGIATLLMFIALLSGIVTHRRIFKDFFTFRPTKGGQRAWLDAHNVTGVLVLPFYLLITFSGLMLMHSLYMPAGIAAAYPSAKGADTQSYFADLQGESPEQHKRPAPGQKTDPLPPIALQPIMAAANAHWGAGHIGRLQARRDAQGRAVVQVTHHASERLQYPAPRLFFDAATGQLLHAADPQSPAIQTYGVLQGLHMAHFAGPGMRWALFGFGVLGCLMIATGLVLWSVKRSAQNQRKNTHSARPTPLGERLVNALNIATLAGLPLACGIYLAANRLLPLEVQGRADAELAWFFSAWGLALLWALACTVLRESRMGWPVLLGLAGLAWALLPLLNALATSTHLGATLPAGEWAWAGMDLAFLSTGVLLGWLAWRLRPGRAPQGKTTTTALQRAAPTAVLAITPEVASPGA